MITHNGTYLLHATHHGMPIYAATMGGKMVIGGWLLSATLQAIVAAFGAEGTEVIAKTNDYLNQIATTDPQRALLLAGFINEDPMLVCSLVETSKTRWLYPDTVGNYFNTGFNAKVAPTCEVLMMAKNNNDADYWGNSPIGNAHYYANFESALQYYRYGSSTSINTGVSLPIGEAHLWSVGKEIKLDGVLRYTTSNTYTPNESQTPIYIFRSGRGYPNTFNLAMFKIYDGEELKHTFVPFRRNGQMELLDILTGTLATRVGTFTEQLTPATTS